MFVKEAEKMKSSKQASLRRLMQDTQAFLDLLCGESLRPKGL